MKGRFALVGFACALLILAGAGCTPEDSQVEGDNPPTKVAGDTVSNEGGDINETPNMNEGESNEDTDNEKPDGKGGMVY